MTSIPTSRIQEVVLCTTGPPLRYRGQELHYTHGVATVMNYLLHAAVVAVSSQALAGMISSVTSPQLRGLSRIIALSTQWNDLHTRYPRFLGVLFDERRDENLSELNVELRDGADVFEGHVVERHSSSLYTSVISPQ